MFRVILLATLLLVGLGLARGAAEPLSGREIARKALPSVALVIVERTAGAGARRATAFFVSPTVLATSAHVVEDARRIGVLLTGEKSPRLVKVVALDQAADLALIEIISGISPGPPANPLYQISAPISPGSSGGPVLSETGRVVGVVRSMATAGQNLNFAMPVATLRALIARAGLTRPAVAGKAGETSPQVAGKAGETSPQDPSGWQRARWGMSPAEVKAALLLIDRPPSPARARALYPAFVLLTEIGGIEYRVALDFDMARDTFERVRFVPKVAGTARTAFDSLPRRETYNAMYVRNVSPARSVRGPRDG